MHFVRILMVLLAFGVWSGAAEPSDLAARVYQIFKAKCADCHGAHMPKPKGKFGYVLDLERIGKNPEYVTPGNAEDSEIYKMVLHNEMPGEDADVPPLTPDELKAVAEWIKAGSPGFKGDSESAAPAPVVETAQKKERTFVERTLALLGRFHPASTHFPVGLLLAAVIAEAIAWYFKQENWLLVVRFLVVMSALSAPVVATLGWLTAKYENFNSPLAEWHRWLGVSTAVVAILCAVLVCASECKEGSPERTRFRGALMLGALLVSVTGLLGGFLTFGLDHYKW